MGDRIRVAVIFGGRSGEHEVSLSSARGIMKALDPARYEVLPVGVTREGQWLLNGEPMKQLTATAEKQQAVLSGRAALDVGEDLVAGTELAVCDRRERASPLAVADVVFPVLHGPYGEDGTVQGLLEIAGLPYVGSGVAGSAVGMDKILMKGLFTTTGLRQLPYLAVLRHEWEKEPEHVLDRIERQLVYPLFVKPANLGSSVGVSKARTRGELSAGLDLAACYDRRILVEQGLERPREIEVAVLGNDEPAASIAGEIIPTEKYEFYNYQSKYTEGEAALLIPAPLSDKE
ncbi:MAG: D-alanine--D-alanine ligase family protein, partial [Ardenticatenaceae bacterium]